MTVKRVLFFLIFYGNVFCFAQNKNLDYYLTHAVTNSPVLNDFQSQVLSNNIDSQILAASRRVQVTGNGNNYYAPVINGYGYDAAITNGAQLQALITATKNLLPKKYFNYQFKDLQIIGDSIRNASKITEQDLRKSIISQYITVYGDQLQVDFNNQLQDLLRKEEQILKTLTQKNVYRQVDYLSFLVTYQQQEITQNQLQVQYKNDYATLNYLAGIADTTVTPLDEPGLKVATAFYADTSIFFLKFRTDSLRLINNRNMIDLGYRPHLSLFADGGLQSSLAENPARNFGASIGINFVIPLYDGGQRKLQYTKINIAERTRLRNKEFFQIQYNQQIAQLQQQLYAIESLLGPINRQIKYIETLIDANGKLLETGDIKMTDYVLALNNYITAKNLVVQNMINRYQVISQLNYWKK